MKSTFAAAGFCAWVALSIAGAADALSTAAPPAPAPGLPKSLAEEKAAEAAAREHVRPAARVMATPPPPSRTEVKPPAPDAHSVWVPGHWTPEANAWKWTAGQWATPATPTSVWIEAKYDAKTKQWSPGYWQPDRPDSYQDER